MADSYHLNDDGKVVPYSGGRIHHDTDSWRDATELELEQAKQIAELEAAVDACSARNAADVDRIKELEAELRVYRMYEETPMLLLAEERDQLRARNEALTEGIKDYLEEAWHEHFVLEQNLAILRALLAADSAEKDNDR